MRITLVRDPKPRANCTRGILAVGPHTLVTIERPWIPFSKSKGGTKGVSCVPKGLYKLVRHDTEFHPKTWALVNKDLDVVHYDGDGSKYARTAVLIHSANLASELRGCIAPGMRTAVWPDGQDAVAESRKAMALIKKVLPWTDEHEIEIV